MPATFKHKVILYLGCCAISVQTSGLVYAQDWSARLKNAFGCSQTGNVTLPSVDIIVDDSISMRGFVVVPNGGQYRRLLRHLISRLAGSNVTIRHLNDLNRRVRNIDSLLDEAFYKEDDTPLENAFEHIANDKHHVSVLISDLEQSTKEGDIRDAAAALNPALDTKPFVFVGGFRSDHSDQQRPRCSPHCAPQSKRAAYVLVFASSSEALHAFMKRTQLEGLLFEGGPDGVQDHRLSGPFFFYSKGPAAEVERGELLGAALGTGDGGAGRFEMRQVDCGGEGRPRPLFVYHIRHTVDGAKPLRLSLHARVQMPVEALGRVRICVDKETDRSAARGSGANSQNCGSWAKLADHDHARPLVSDMSFELEYEWDLPRPRRWLVYRVRMYPAPEDINPPPWVTSWAEDDAAGRPASPCLLALASTILAHVTQHEPMLEHFVAVTRE